jgi:hypothetical protein
MNWHRRERNIKTLWASVLLGIAYSSLLYYQRTLTGINRADGIIGVMLGLYICSNPAANFLDMFFFERGTQLQFSSWWSAVFWLALNLAVLMIGWFVIFVGTTRLVGGAD